MLKGFERVLKLGTRMAVVAMISASVGAAALAQSGKTAVNVDENGVILHGYDAVAYQIDAKPVKGSVRFTATHDGAIYQFASAEHRDAFRADPAKYAPAYGGYCAMGVAVGKKLDGAPEAYSVVNGKLYLNVSAQVRGMWSRDVGGNEAKAVKNWASVQGRAGFDKM